MTKGKSEYYCEDSRHCISKSGNNASKEAGLRSEETTEALEWRTLVNKSSKDVGSDSAPAATTIRKPIDITACQKKGRSFHGTKNSTASMTSMISENRRYYEIDESMISSAGSRLNTTCERFGGLGIETLDDRDEKKPHGTSATIEETAESNVIPAGTSTNKAAKLNPNAPEFHPGDGRQPSENSTTNCPKPLVDTVLDAAYRNDAIGRGSRAMEACDEILQRKLQGAAKVRRGLGGMRAMRMCSFRKPAYADRTSKHSTRRKNQPKPKESLDLPVGSSTSQKNEARHTGRYLYQETRVTMVDNTYKIFVVDMVPPQICDLILRLTEEHLENNAGATPGKETWRKLYSYTTMDLPCCEVRFLRRITDQVMDNVVKVVGEVFHCTRGAASLRPRTWKEPHLLRYQKIEGKTVHTGVELHWDGSDITWQLMLSDENEYDGTSC
jgi:hypothetical protein